MSENIQVPQGWEVIEFCNIVNLRNKKYIPNQNDNIKCIELECIEKENGNLLYYINSNTQKSTKNYFYKNDVLYGKLRPYLKKYFYATFDGVCSTEIWVFNATNKIDSYYLFLIIQSNKFNQYTNISTGTRMPRADWNIVSNMPILLPPLEEQKKIADILYLWDKAIEQTKELIAYKEKQKKGLMQALLTGKKRLQGFTDEWKTYKLKELLKECNIRNKNNIENNILSVSNKYGFIKQTDFFDKIVASKDTCNYKIIYINQFAYNPSRINVGSIALLKNYESGILSPMYIVFECINELYNIYFNYWIQSYLFMGIIKSYLSGSVRDSLNFKDMARISITIPPLDEQKAIADILSTADEEINLLNKQLELYTEQKKGLMQNLLTGKVRV